MNGSTWILVCAVAIGVVTADVSHLGYNYKVPQTSYGVPSYQSAGSNYNTGYTQSSGSAGPSAGYQGLNAGQIVYQGHQGHQGHQGSQGYTGYQGSGSSQLSSLVGNQGYSGYQGVNAVSGTSGLNQYYPSVSSNEASSSSGSFVQPTFQVSGGNQGQSYQYQNQYQTSQQQKYQYQFQTQPAQVFKHFYVHEAPQESEEAKPRNPVLLPPPQKHYKIIFIKTPSQAGSASQIVPVQQQHEEKTIVYVLVKKPEDYQDVVLPKIEQKPPSKPEVYFIKYKNKEDSQAVINNIVKDYDKGQNFVSISGADAAQSGSSGVYTGQVNGGAGDSFVSQSGLTSGSTGGSSTGSIVNQGDASSSAASVEYTGQQLIGSAQGISDSQLASVFTSVGQSENLGQQTSGLTFGNESSGGLNIATAQATGAGVVSSNYDSSASSTATYDNLNALSTSQGVPHESYGVPKFKEH